MVPLHALKAITSSRLARTQTIVTSVLLQGLGQYNKSNNIFKRLFGLYLYATGTQRQTITVASHLGLSESYVGVVGKKYRRKKKTKKKDAEATPALPDNIMPDSLTQELVDPTEESWTKGGSLRQLSDCMRQTYRTIASSGLFGAVYDNINWSSKAAEQVVGRTDSLESGTCATIWPLWKATEEDIQLKPFLDAFLAAGPLELSDIVHTPEEAALFRRCLVHSILKIIITYGGEGFQQFADNLARSVPTTTDKIEKHKTPIHPVTTFNIDESTIVGNAEFAEAFYSELDVLRHNLFSLWVKFLGGDQLSIARLRSLFNIRAGHEPGFPSFSWGAWMPGLFHAKIADAHGFLVTHWGKPDCATRNPGSLWFHNTTLHRLPIKLSSLPTFRVGRDLIFVSLYSRILHCLLLVSGMASLQEYLLKVSSFETLTKHATEILDRYANPSTVDDLRRQRRETGDGEGDMVFENAVLFLRDALVSREFADAIKAGDSGRVVLVLKIWALSFRGNGRSKYAYEMLHILHNLSRVWPKTVAKVVLNNWLVNPTGSENGFVEIDLMQEHNNFWIKTFYKAHGSAASWEWLEMISPCINILRRIAGIMNGMLGSYQGTKHEPVELRRDIAVLMASLTEHGVYTLKKGRVLDADDVPAPDVILDGIEALTDSASNPLDEYNAAFQRLQARYSLTPITTHLPTEEGNSETEGTQSTEAESEFVRVMEEEDEPTLQRTTQDDVALDMDAEESDSSDSDEDYDDDDNEL